MTVLINEMPWRKAEEYFRANDTVIFPIGCLHAHDHIPLGIDNMSVEVLARRVGERTGTLVMPTLNYGWMPQYMDYPGTVTIGSDTLMQLVMEVCLCLERWGVKKVVFMNGHGGNTPYLLEVGCKLRERGMVSPILEWWKIIQGIDPELSKAVARVPEAAGGRPGMTRGTETAVAMALGDFMEPEDIRVVYTKEVLGAPFEQVWFQGVRYKGVVVPMPFKTREAVEEGPVGTCATREQGMEILEKCIEYMAGFVRALKAARV